MSAQYLSTPQRYLAQAQLPLDRLLAAYQEVIELAPSNAEAYLGIGLTYWNMDEKDLAISSWQKSMLIKPENNESQGWLILSKQES